VTPIALGGSLAVPSSDSSVVRFGTYELNLASGELRKGGILVKLQPQPFKVLALLVERPGQVVAREELRQKVWGDDTFVDFEQGLNYCIKQIRLALNDDADTPRYVETLPRRGYRFIAPVERLEPEGVAPSTAPPEDLVAKRAPPMPHPRPMGGTVAIAFLLVVALLVLIGWQRGWFGKPTPEQKLILIVLPFQSLSGNPEDEHLRLGLTEAMISELGRLKPDRLGVIARSTAMTFDRKGVSAEDVLRALPDVDYVLEGSVQHAGDRVVISASLIQAREQTVLWSEPFERPAADVIALQSDVARRVADGLALTLLPEEKTALARTKTVNPEAQDLYFRGRYYWRRRVPEALLKSIEFYERAIALDSTFALPYTGLADSYTILGSTPHDARPPREVMPKAKQAAQKAIALDDRLSEAHAALGLVLMEYDWDWAGADREFRRAIELAPSNSSARQWYAIYFWHVGRFDAAHEQLEQAQKLDPLSIPIRLTVGVHFYYLRQYDRAIAEVNRAVEMEPNYFANYFHLGLALLHSGRHAEALTALERSVKLSEGTPAPQAALGYAYAVTGKPQEARKILEDLKKLSRKRHVPAMYIAAIYTGLGEKQQALEWLERGYEERSQPFVHVHLEPSFDPLRAEPRFQELVRRIGLRPR